MDLGTRPRGAMTQATRHRGDPYALTPLRPYVILGGTLLPIDRFVPAQVRAVAARPRWARCIEAVGGVQQVAHLLQCEAGRPHAADHHEAGDDGLGAEAEPAPGAGGWYGQAALLVVTDRAQGQPGPRGDLADLHVSVVHLTLIPEAISFSIIAGVDPAVGLFASFTTAVTISVVGGRRVVISAATGAIALVAAPLGELSGGH